MSPLYKWKVYKAGYLTFSFPAYPEDHQHFCIETEHATQDTIPILGTEWVTGPPLLVLDRSGQPPEFI